MKKFLKNNFNIESKTIESKPNCKLYYLPKSFQLTKDLDQKYSFISSKSLGKSNDNYSEHLLILEENYPFNTFCNEAF